jgi:GH15 family glucan-1,4-alpha-glucosidase
MRLLRGHGGLLMPLRIEDYALLSDNQTAALVGRDGSVDWLCLPRFDSGAIFAALLGGEEHGRWLICPAGEIRHTRRRYRGDTLILETEFQTDHGQVRLIDFMPLPRGEAPDIVRIVEGVEGSVDMRMQLVLRFDYGQIVPWVRTIGDALVAIAGPDEVCLRTPVELRGEDMTTVAEFTVRAGQRVPFVLTWKESHLPPPKAVDPERALADTEGYWRDWIGRCNYEGPWEEAVHRSLLVLKGLTYEPTGGIVAAPTTSLPEQLGGSRNWDYRYCWLRDATLTLHSLMETGFTEEARAWRAWLLRAVAGDPQDLQIMYGVAGERRIPEWEAEWLPGYEHSAPVRIGNAAVEQFQLDVYGEVIDALHQARMAGLQADDASWQLQRVMLDFVEKHWQQPDEGIWEVRGPRRPFVYSRAMAWVAMDRAVCTVRDFGLDGPMHRWQKVRDQIKAEVLEHGYDPKRKTFTMYYGSKELDAAVLMLPLVGFLPANDERVVGTVAAIERELLADGFVQRYTQDDSSADGLPPGEGAFLACSFWLVDNYALQGRVDDAMQLFERLLSLRNDVGLLAEEYDPRAGRQVGNFPQAFSHLPLINTARHLTTGERTRVPRVGSHAARAELFE